MDKNLIDMDESLISDAIELMKRDSFFIILQIYQNRNVSPFIREILRERINIHKVVFYRLKEMRILFNRGRRITEKLGVLKIKFPKLKIPRTKDLLIELWRKNNVN